MSERKGIVHPLVDAICVGGLSILVIGYILAFRPEWNDEKVIENFVYLSALINFPHFMATYILLYTSPKTVKTYRWSSTWMPLLLAAYCVIAVIASPSTDLLVTFAMFVAGGYLAWHYTGQTWGMMAVFSFVSGEPFNDKEKKIIRFGLRTFLTFHVFWFLTVFINSKSALYPILAPTGSSFADIYPIVSGILIAGAILCGAIGLGLYARRIQKMPDIRILIAFMAVCCWYIALSIEPTAIFWAQLGHSLQYLLFPVRVEINRTTAKQGDFNIANAALYVMILVGMTFFVFKMMPWSIDLMIAQEEMRLGAREALVAFVNIHHFFADGALWKISNPEVKKDLFSHLKR